VAPLIDVESRIHWYEIRAEFDATFVIALIVCPGSNESKSVLRETEPRGRDFVDTPTGVAEAPPAARAPLDTETTAPVPVDEAAAPYRGRAEMSLLATKAVVGGG